MQQQLIEAEAKLQEAEGQLDIGASSKASTPDALVQKENIAEDEGIYTERRGGITLARSPNATHFFFLFSLFFSPFFSDSLLSACRSQGKQRSWKCN
jgi:hypothetical protein